MHSLQNGKISLDETFLIHGYSCVCVCMMYVCVQCGWNVYVALKKICKFHPFLSFDLFETLLPSFFWIRCASLIDLTTPFVPRFEFANELFVIILTLTQCIKIDFNTFSMLVFLLTCVKHDIFKSEKRNRIIIVKQQFVSPVSYVAFNWNVPRCNRNWYTLHIFAELLLMPL